MCSWMAYERPIDDAHDKEKAHRQTGLIGLIRGPEKEISKPRERQ